jgi:hypothetical protein
MCGLMFQSPLIYSQIELLLLLVPTSSPSLVQGWGGMFKSNSRAEKCPEGCG